MAIEEKYQFTGVGNTEALSGNIVFDQNLGEFRQTKMVEGQAVVVFRMSGAGIEYYNDAGNLLQRIAPDGTYYYDGAGNLLQKVSAIGIEYYNSAGDLIQRISASGTEFFTASGKLQHRIDTTGDHYYDNNAVERLVTGIDSYGQMRMLFKNTQNVGQILIGQNPANAKPVFAVSSDATIDVETALLGN